MLGRAAVRATGGTCPAVVQVPNLGSNEHRPMSRERKRLLAVIVPLQVLLAVLAWRDLGRRTDDQVRGQKRIWRIFVVMNPGNAVAYWLFGRR